MFTGACGSAADWPKLGTSTLTNSSATSPYGTTKGGNTIAALSRGQDDGTMWAGTGAGRVLISKNINAADPTTVTFTRLDDDSPATPGRAVSSIYADPTNPNHAIVTFSGFNVSTPATPGHVFDVVFDPNTGLSTWTDISYDIGDQPVNDAVLDTATGDIYISTDFSVFTLTHGDADVDARLRRSADGRGIRADACEGAARAEPVHLRGDARPRGVPAHAAARAALI